MHTNPDVPTDEPASNNTSGLTDDELTHAVESQARRDLLVGSTGYTYAGPGAISGGEA